MENNKEEIVKEMSTNLTVSDMKVINNIIQLAGSKGLFKVSEFVIVGNIFEKINSIVNSVANESNI
jgi:hypothetical protein